MIPDSELIARYDVPGPRYTSYPTAVDFRTVEDRRLRDRIVGSMHERRRSRDVRRPLSVYVHIPFCHSLCWYCGCTKVITRDPSTADRYLEMLEMEMDRTIALLGGSEEVVQLHFGGGTPTFLQPDQLERLGRALHDRFRISDETEFSVEIDPRRCERERIDVLRQIGCNRASVGVQDTDGAVQRAIHRNQTFDQTRQVTGWLREAGIESINVDLIYGLPKQTPGTFRITIEEILELEPDRLALYSYAHLPDRMPSQRLLDERDLPRPAQKLQMFIEATGRLIEEGMRWIGMDHFARSEDALSRALDEGSLQSNFQGYTTFAESDLVALGMSGISQFDTLYYQNEKELDRYYAELESGRLPVLRTLELDDEDRLRREVIMAVMCRNRIDLSPLVDRWGERAAEIFEQGVNSLAGPEDDGLVRCSDEGIEITGKGRFFLRNIAMAFDPSVTVLESLQRYSRTV